METLGAIDIGSNAIRLVIGTMDEHGDIRIVKKVREPVRLGKDVFDSGVISEKTREKAIAAFQNFRAHLKAHDVHFTRAVATSALREAKGRDEFVAEVKKASGIEIEIIDGIEEGRLVYSAVSHRMNIKDKVVLLIDIGGGSVELSIADHGVRVATQTFKMGTVRLLQFLENRGLKEKHLREIVREHAGPVREFLKIHLGKLHLDMAVGTGGNFETLGKLRVAILHKNSIFSMTREELGELVDHLESMSVKERIQYLRLRPDRADVIVPAARVTQEIMELAGVELLSVPYVGLRDGILADVGSRVMTAQAKT